MNKKLIVALAENGSKLAKAVIKSLLDPVGSYEPLRTCEMYSSSSGSSEARVISEEVCVVLVLFSTHGYSLPKHWWPRVRQLLFTREGWDDDDYSPFLIGASMAVFKLRAWERFCRDHPDFLNDCPEMIFDMIIGRARSEMSGKNPFRGYVDELMKMPYTNKFPEARLQEVLERFSWLHEEKIARKKEHEKKEWVSPLGLLVLDALLYGLAAKVSPPQKADMIGAMITAMQPPQSSTSI